MLAKPYTHRYAVKDISETAVQAMDETMRM
jgi:hypothetical protein